MQLQYLYIILVAICICGCSEKKNKEMTPWGEPIDADTNAISTNLSMDDMMQNGELIMLTMSGPDTYFEYHGRGMGTQFLLCEKFAQHLGVSLRVEVCKSTDEMLRRLKDGEADLIACQMPKATKGTIPCGYAVDSLKTSWLTGKDSKELADSINRWYTPKLIAQIQNEERLRYSTQSVHRHTYAPMLNVKSGIISQYDHLFIKYSPIARWDWRLLAAQCYQESCFDPKAYSWAGACGLMQIMPSTAAELGLPTSKIYDPEDNIYASTRYINKLNSCFQDVRDPLERQSFVLGSYNGGAFHIRDAMALTRKYGKNQYKWSDVAEFVLKLSTPQYYNDPVVKHGYMRGHETVTYVARIHDRWRQYRGAVRGNGATKFLPGITPGGDIPHKAARKHRFKL